MSDLPEAGRRGIDRPAWIEVDLDAIAHNVRAIARRIGPNRRVAAVVKAEAYGHGAVAVSRTVLEAGAVWLAVARVAEGVTLRRAGIDAPILVLGAPAISELKEAVEHELRPTLVLPEQARALSRAAVEAGVRVPVHVELDTGISRYGVPLEDALKLLREIKELPGLELEGVFSHFATADDADLDFARQQLRAFDDGMSSIRAEGYSIGTVHMAASAAILSMADRSAFDMVRLGLSMHGVYPSEHLRSTLELRPALSMWSRITRVYDLKPGQSVGYGRTFVATRPTRAALVQVGYADGLPRSHSNRGALLIRGRRAPLIGLVSMDQCVVDVSDCGEVAADDLVAVIGSQGAERISIDEFAARSGTIAYEALTGLGYRVPRVYVRSGEVVGVGYLDEGRVEWARG